MGRKHYWITVKRIEAVEEGTDRWAMRNGFVAMTPLRLDLTDDAVLTSMLETAPVGDSSSQAVERARF
jgi:5'-nucleotidase